MGYGSCAACAGPRHLGNQQRMIKHPSRLKPWPDLFSGNRLENEHRHTRSKHGYCGNSHDNPSQARTRLSLHELLIRGYD